ncbi:MAG: hypothetical protein WKF75_00190 [Singulisphaera sp.]
MPPPQVHVFTPCQIARGPDEIRGQPGSLVFIYSRYTDPEGNRWFVRPGHVGHEQMTNTHGMLQALFGPDAGQIAQQVVSIGDVYSDTGHGYPAPTGERREIWDWYSIRGLAKRENLFGRSGRLDCRRVVMLWGTPSGWEAMLIEVLGHLGIGSGSDALVVVLNLAQYEARLFIPPVRPGDHDRHV